MTRYRIAFPVTITKRVVAELLAAQPNNQGKSPEYLADKWIVSDTFTLTTVFAGLSELGINHGKTGQSRTPHAPIVVDENINQVARAEGNYGAAPDFLVLDGQNRVVALRNTGDPLAKIQAYVGDVILDKLTTQNERYENKFLEVEAIVDHYLSSESPGRDLAALREYVRRGLLSQERLEHIRDDWRARWRR